MSANNRDDIDPKEALRVVGREYDRLLHDETAEAKNVAARHTALKVILTHRDLLLKLLGRGDAPGIDLGAARAAIAMEDPHDDDDEAGDPG